MAREGDGLLSSHAEAKKMKSLTLHTHGCLELAQGTALLLLLLLFFALQMSQCLQNYLENIVGTVETSRLQFPFD